jgi:TolB protein
MRVLGRGRLAAMTLFGLATCYAVPERCQAQIAVDTVIKITNIENAYPSWSPDGSRLVFQSNRSGHWVLYTMNADGSDVAALTEDQFRSVGPVWSPDGTLILYVSNNEDEWEDLWVVRPDGTGKRNVTNTPSVNESHPHWGPGGRRIIFNATTDVTLEGNEEVYEMNLDGSDLRKLTTYDGWDTYASLSPDGARIVWRRVLTTGESWREGWNSEIFVMNRGGTAIRNLSRHPSFDGYPTWSPDGAQILFSSDRSGTFQLYVMDADGSNVQRLIESSGEDVRPSWSPDGTRIAFNRDRDGSIEILIARLTSGSY